MIASASPIQFDKGNGVWSTIETSLSTQSFCHSLHLILPGESASDIKSSCPLPSRFKCIQMRLLDFLDPSLIVKAGKGNAFV